MSLPRARLRGVLALSTAMAALACGETARRPLSAGIGPHPQLPPPVKSLVPTIKVADATGWPRGTTPTAAPATRVNAFATGRNSVHVAGTFWPAALNRSLRYHSGPVVVEFTIDSAG